MILALALTASVSAKEYEIPVTRPIENELPHWIFKGRTPTPPMTPKMAEALKKARPGTRKLVDLFAARKAQLCGVCPTRTDEAGVHCGAAEGAFDNCGHGCGQEILLVSAAALKKAGFLSEKGGLREGEVLAATDQSGIPSLIQYAQAKNGYTRSSFTAGAVATCR